MKTKRCTARCPRRPRGLRAAVCLALLCAVAGARTAAAGPLQPAVVDPIMRALDQWQLDAAESAIAALERAEPGHPTVSALRARLRFLAHDFRGAEAELGPRCAPDGPVEWREVCGALRRALALTSDFKAVTTAPGHFVLHYPPGPEEVLVPYAEDALERAYQELGKIFRTFPSRPVHVDILARAEQLVALSPLSESEIETTGTVGITQFNRILVVSPRDLVHGYPWLDTLAHEYVHYLLTLRAGERLPLWLQEGLAKFFESRWRESRNALPTARERAALQASVRARTLLSFERLGPSLAKLPSQEAAAESYAALSAFVGFLYERGGLTALDRLIETCAGGRSADDALRSVYGARLSHLERQFRASLLAAPQGAEKAAAPLRRLFRGRHRAEDEIRALPETEARDLTYLGDLLRARGRPFAALAEYRKAQVFAGPAVPLLQAKIAAALLALGANQQVVDELRPALQSEPGYVLLHLYLGQALIELGRPDEARAQLEEAVRLNPFDPGVHRYLAAAYDALGRTTDAAFARRQQALRDATTP